MTTPIWCAYCASLPEPFDQKRSALTDSFIKGSMSGPVVFVEPTGKHLHIHHAQIEPRREDDLTLGKLIWALKKIDVVDSAPEGDDPSAGQDFDFWLQYEDAREIVRNAIKED